MDAREEMTARIEQATGPDLEAVKGVFDRIERKGVVAGVEHLVTFCHDDVELRSYVARAGGAADDLIRGRDAILDFFRTREETGYTIRVRTRGYDVRDDTVTVRGTTRVGRPDGSFAETSLSWSFRFREGLVEHIAWSPRAGG